MKAMGLKHRIKKTAMKSMNSITADIFKKLATEAGKLCTHSTGLTLGAPALESAIKICFPG